MSRQIGVAEIISGSISLVRARPAIVIACIILDVALNSALNWTDQRLELEMATFTLLVAAVILITTFCLTFGLRSGRGAFGMGPTELFIRSMYGVAVWTITTVATAAGMIFLILPGLYLLGRWFVSIPLVLIDGCGIGEALAESWLLTEKSVWPLASVSALVFGASIGSAYIAEALMGSYPTLVEWFNGVHLVINAFCTTFGAVAAVFAYNALSLEPEGLAETFT